jgi:hypothetical protein
MADGAGQMMEHELPEMHYPKERPDWPLPAQSTATQKRHHRSVPIETSPLPLQRFAARRTEITTGILSGRR